MAKRICMIGIKVTEDTRDKIEYLAGRDSRPISSFINIVLQNYLTQYDIFKNDDWKIDLQEQRKQRGGE